MRKIAGVDYSLTSPAICVWKSDDDIGPFGFDSCDLYYLESSKQQSRTTDHGILNLHPEPYPEWNTEEERHDLLSDWVTIISGCETFIEGYGIPTVVENLMYVLSQENMGLLKHKLYKQHQSFTSIPPTVIKKYATGKGIQ